ncbi:MAG: FAD-dependent oxidoreductase [Acidobacteria bacterium]|nr:FAD-dependent oxidoreductase [Acidobacteriota bacterium]
MQAGPAIAVLGAGWAGLATAADLAGRGFRVIVLEKRAVAGGRAYSYTDPETGDVLDNGPHVYLGCYASTLAFLRRIGAPGAIRMGRALRIAYADRERGRYRLRCPALPSPWNLLLGLLFLRGLDPGDRVRALAVGRRLRRTLGSDRTDLEDIPLRDWLDRLGQTAAIRRAVWDPIATAALNEDPAAASTAVFARVFDEAFLSGARSALGLGAFGLSDVFVGPAIRYLGDRSAEVRFGSGVARLRVGSGGVDEVELGDGARIVADAYVSALPPRELLAVVPDRLRSADPVFRGAAGLETSPIVSVHLWYDRPILDEPFVGLLGTRTQWIFDRWAILGPAGRGNGLSPAPEAGLSAVISAARDCVDRPASDIIAMVQEDMAACVPASRSARLLRARVVKERDATLSPRPGTSRLRPGSACSLSNLVLAGDWTATGLPGCIEGAVRSGVRAAAAAAGFLQGRLSSGAAPAQEVDAVG